MNDLDPKGEAGSRKCPLHLIPPVAMELTAWVHKHGAEKYGPYNWRKSKVCATTYVAAIMRHLNAFRDGEDLDPESGLPHLAHIGASVNILLDAQACGTLVDDRSIRAADEQTLRADGRLELLNNQEKRHNLEMSALREELAATRLQLAKQITPS